MPMSSPRSFWLRRFSIVSRRGRFDEFAFEFLVKMTLINSRRGAYLIGLSWLGMLCWEPSLLHLCVTEPTNCPDPAQAEIRPRLGPDPAQIRPKPRSGSDPAQIRSRSSSRSGPDPAQSQTRPRSLKSHRKSNRIKNSLPILLWPPGWLWPALAGSGWL